MSAPALASAVNGFMPTGPRAAQDAAEFKKILKLRDEILAGTHPRLTVHAHTNRKVSPVPVVQAASVPLANVLQPFPFTSKQSQLPGLGRGSEESSQERPQKPIQRTPTTTITTFSGIDPVLLTKSDDLVRAEIQLRRQRLEKGLKDQFEQKRQDARKRPALGEAKPDFDVATILARALDKVKPDAGFSSKEDASVSSFDENSLYSSKAPDSTPEAGELEDEPLPENQASFTRGVDTNASAETPAIPTETLTPARSGHYHEPALPPSADVRSQYNPSYPGPPNFRRPSGIDAADNDDEDDEEGEYSPPAAVEQPRTLHEYTTQPLDPRSRPLRRYSDVENGGPGSPHDGHMRIVRNHIISPIAPQPSRVSPLAVAKDSITLQNNRIRNGRGPQHGRGNQSPEPTSANLHPKKRRKLEKNNGRRRRTGGGSPDVKDEPVSPPPFHDVQPLGSGRPRATAQEPIMIDDGPTEVRYVRASGQYIDTPNRPISRMVEPAMPYSEPRATSRSMMRPVREEPDLRRVASLHNMRTEQPMYAEQIYPAQTPRQAGPYMQVDSPIREEVNRYAQNLQDTYEQDHNRPVRTVRTPAPGYRQTYADAEPEVRYVSQPMPPPPSMERIVIDEFGRKYREIVQERPSAPPRATPAYVDRDQVVYENYHPPRAGSVMIEAPRDDRYAEDMPPPRIIRQVGGPSSSTLYEPMPTSRAVSVAAIDRPSRQPVYVDDMSDFRPPPRMGSVRPAPSRYEDHAPMQTMPRSGSIHPQVRQGSMYVEDRPSVRGEYMQMERPQYQVTSRSASYIDAQGREVLLGPVQDDGVRYARQY